MRTCYEQVIAWCVVGVRTVGKHQAGAVASSRGEVNHKDKTG
jgi:hypothetical protein